MAVMLSDAAEQISLQDSKFASCKMQKVLIALMAMGANAFAPAAAPKATVVQQGVPLANGAMEFDRGAPASGRHRCAFHNMRRRRARAHACNN